MNTRSWFVANCFGNIAGHDMDRDAAEALAQQMSALFPFEEWEALDAADEEEYERRAEIGVYDRCRNCAYLVENDDGIWICDDCGKNVADIPDKECSANQSW